MRAAIRRAKRRFPPIQGASGSGMISTSGLIERAVGVALVGVVGGAVVVQADAAERPAFRRALDGAVDARFAVGAPSPIVFGAAGGG